MNILFRVDAGNRIGLGHYYRSLNLALRLRNRGHNIFFTHSQSDFWQNEINKGFPFETIVVDAKAPNDQTWQYILKKNIQIYYVDGLIDFDEEFISKLKTKVKIIFYQNLTSSKRFADIFILPSIHHKNSFFDEFNHQTEIYKGLCYFIFSPTLSSLNRNKNIKQNISSIAIIAGGSDPENTILILYNHLNEINKQFKYNFYFGIDYLHKQSIPSPLPCNISFNIFNHKEILKNDILISAFGVSTYEFLYLGMPIISYGHQKSNSEASDWFAHKKKVLISLGDVKKINSQQLEYNLDKIQKYTLRKELTQKAKDLLDLKGPDRIVTIIESCFRNEIK